MSCSIERIFLVLNYPSQIQTKTLLTGIKQDLENPSIYYITGFIEEPSKLKNYNAKIINNFDKQVNYKTFVYKGNLSGISISDQTNWHMFNYPSSLNNTVTNTNLYGPSIFQNTDKIRVVGNYTTLEGGNVAYGCLYQGLLDGEGKWLTILPYGAIQTIVHSTMGDLAVGNFLTKDSPDGKAFIYNIRKNEYLEIIKKGAYSIRAYGVWKNSKNSYIICGGYSEHASVHTGNHIAFVCDFDIKYEKFSNWQSFNYNNTKNLITHFEGISGTDKGYSLAADSTFEKKRNCFYSLY